MHRQGKVSMPHGSTPNSFTSYPPTNFTFSGDGVRSEYTPTGCYPNSFT